MVRCAAGALVITGVKQQQITSLRDLVYPLDRPEAIIRFFLQRLGNGKTSPMTQRVALTLVLVARDYCCLPEKDVERISGWATLVRLPAQQGLTAKNLRRLRALIQPRARAMLLNFPQELMRRAAAPGLKPCDAARLAMYAVAMEILLICPMRRKNLAELRLDRHLYRPDPRRKRLTHLLIDAGEVKNSNAIQWPVPPESARLIEAFLTHHRPHLVEPGNPYLFGTGDKQRCAQHLGEWLSAAVTEAIGVEFNVHLARHSAAWNFLRENPGQYEVVRQVLGHRSIQVTMAHYVGLEADSAAAHFDATVLRDRHAGRKIAAYAFRQITPQGRRK
jgi:integrase